MLYLQVNNFSVMSGDFLGWTKTKQLIECLAQGHNTVTPPAVSLVIAIVLRRRDTKESTCLLWDITTEKSDLCCYAVRITKNAYVKK